MSTCSSDKRNEATIKELYVDNAESNDFPGNFSAADDAWDIKKFMEKFKIEMRRIEKNEIEFDMIGVSPAIANAFRRILISEVPTIAVEKVFITNNTSIFQDDFLAHRLGLIPLCVDPRFFEYRSEGDLKGTPQDTVTLRLKVKCIKKSLAPKDACTPDDLYENRRVYSKHLKWIPAGNQREIFKEDIRPVDDDILIAKLSPGQELDLDLHCVKGIGRDHAKFSPVATASYRLLPKIKLLREVKGDDALELQKCFPEGVIVVEKVEGELVAKSGDGRNYFCDRNIFMNEKFKNAVEQTLVKDHFIFTIESTGALRPEVLFTEAIEILIGKCRSFLGELEEYEKRKLE